MLPDLREWFIGKMLGEAMSGDRYGMSLSQHYTALYSIA
jgi:hypothetical protein